MNQRHDMVVFDFDGTLIDSRIDIASSINYTLERLGLAPLSVEKITSFVGRGVKSLLSEALGPHAEEKFKPGLSIFRTHYRDHCLERTQLYPNARDVIRSCPVRRKAIVTNKPHAFTEIILKGLDIDTCFDRVLSGDRVPRRKPAPDPLLMLMDEFNINAAHLLMVGDSPLDIEMGKAAGAVTCAALYGYGSRDALKASRPDFAISDISELVKIFCT